MSTNPVSIHVLGQSISFFLISLSNPFPRYFFVQSFSLYYRIFVHSCFLLFRCPILFPFIVQSFIPFFFVRILFFLCLCPIIVPSISLSHPFPFISLRILFALVSLWNLFSFDVFVQSSSFSSLSNSCSFDFLCRIHFPCFFFVQMSSNRFSFHFFVQSLFLSFLCLILFPVIPSISSSTLFPFIPSSNPFPLRSYFFFQFLSL